MTDEEAPVGRQTLAERLNVLFETFHPGQREPFSARYVASAITAAAVARGDSRYEITHSYISLLRSGDRSNPTMKHLEALAGFFRVPVAYFFVDDHDAKHIAEQAELLAIMADVGVREVAVRAVGLSPDSLRTITEVIRQVRKLEGLDQDPPRRVPSAEDGQGGPLMRTSGQRS